MALVRDEYWLKLAGLDRSREKRESMEIWRLEKIKEVGFKARKKLIARKRECSARVGRSRAGDCGGVVCPERRILDVLVESSISGERSCGTIDLQT